MATPTIWRLDEAMHGKPREQAAAHGVSAEADLRERLGPVPPRRAKSMVSEPRKLSIKPDKPLDLKRLSEAMWNESLG